MSFSKSVETDAKRAKRYAYEYKDMLAKGAALYGGCRKAASEGARENRMDEAENICHANVREYAVLTERRDKIEHWFSGHHANPTVNRIHNSFPEWHEFDGDTARTILYDAARKAGHFEPHHDVSLNPTQSSHVRQYGRALDEANKAVVQENIKQAQINHAHDIEGRIQAEERYNDQVRVADRLLSKVVAMRRRLISEGIREDLLRAPRRNPYHEVAEEHE